MKKIFCVIPAFNPDETLIEIVQELKKNYTIVVVDDGSNDECKEIFKKIEKDVNLKVHPYNKGKGEALKTGIRESIENGCWGIVTVDSDGQHTLEDIQRISEALENENCIIFGVRDFTKMPVRNRIGNKISRKIIEKRYGKEISDTQTGLRGIPVRYLEQFCTIEGKRFEYETEVLKYILKSNIKYKEVKINTVYDKKIKSKFEVIKDSLCVFFCCIR